MTNTDDFNATATDLLLAIADLTAPQSDDTLDELTADFKTALDQLECDAPLRDAIADAFHLILHARHDAYASCCPTNESI